MATASLIGLLAAGAVAGVLAGLLGIGGGIVLVPVLLVWLDSQSVDPSVATHIALATALATMLATAPASAYSHHRRGAIDVERIHRWGPWIAAGALLGAGAARWIPGTWLRALFSLLAIWVGYRLLRKTGDRPTVPARFDRAATPTAIGLVSAWLGIGGGSFTVPVQIALGTPTQRAVGTSALLGLFIALPATMGYVVGGLNVAGLPDQTFGFVHWPAALALALTAALFAPLGARLAHRLPADRLRQVFGVFLALTGLKLASGLAGT